MRATFLATVDQGELNFSRLRPTCLAPLPSSARRLFSGGFKLGSSLSRRSRDQTGVRAIWMIR
jgi:hypothetical protein